MLATWGTSTGRNPTLDLQFAGATSLDNRITFSRGSQATLFDSTGALVYAKHNLSTNSESTSAFGTPANATLTSTAISTPLPGVTAAGLLVLNVGANTGNSTDGVTLVNSINLPTQTQVTFSAFVKAAGTTVFRLRSNITGSVFSFTLSGTGTAPTPSSDLQAATISALSDGWYRVAWTFTTTTGAPGARADYWTWKTDTANGTAGVYITGTQVNITNMEGGVTSSLTTYYPTVASAYYAPRFDYNPSTLAAQGLLIEEQRTNSIRNNTMQGAVAGTPGTVPTNWTAATSGLTRTVVGTGTSNGITYIDVRFAGTSTNTFAGVYFEASNGVAAANGQTWTPSAWVSVVGGSTANITSAWLQVDQYNNVPTYLSSLSGTNVVSLLNSTPTRYSVALTTNNASTAFIVPSFSIFFANGAAIDITLRIGLPQLEQGAFATSVIPTTTTALTRNADVASMTGTNFSSWYNAVAGSLYTEFVINSTAPTSGFPTGTSLNNGTLNNRINAAYLNDSVNLLDMFVSDGGVTQAALSSGTYTAMTVAKMIGVYATNDFALCTNGGSVFTDTSGTVPTVSRLEIGNQISSNYLNGYIRRISYYPVRLPNSTLQALTA